MKIGFCRCLSIAVAVAFSSIDLSHATAPVVYPANSGMIDVTQPPYSADKTGATDATAAIQAAVIANTGLNPTHTIYFPAGTYLISSTINCLTKAGKRDDRMSFQGAGQGLTILKLTSNNPKFQSPTAPQGVIHLNNIQGNYPNDGLENNVWDMTIDVGSGNPGAIGIDWCACNLATIRNVTVQSSDPNFAGFEGIFCDGAPGPCLIKNVTVTGFATGIYVQSNQLGVTMDNLTLSQQTAYGIYNKGNGVFVRHLTSTNAVPAFFAGKGGLSVLSQCSLTGTTANGPAIAAQAVESPIYLRAISETGYGALVMADSATMQGPAIPTGEYSSHPVTRLFNNAEAGLMLDPTVDAPEYHDDNLSDWADVTSKSFAGGADPTGGADATAAVQAAIDSGATTVYFPMGTYLIAGTVHVRGKVAEIFGNQSLIKISAPWTATIAHPASAFSIDDGTSPFVILDRVYFVNAGGICNAVDQATTRQFVIRDTSMENYINSVPGGTLFMENVEGFSGTFNHTTAYVWQVDPELNYPKILNDNSKLWILGLKTEIATTAVTTINGGKTEVLGGFIFSNSPTWTTPIFINNNSQFFGSFEQYNSASPGWRGWYGDLVREIQSNETKDLRSWDTSPLGFVTAYSNNPGTPVRPVPTASITSPADGQVFTAPANVPIKATASAPFVVEYVQPYQDQNKANILTPSGADYALNPLSAGNYTLYAKATDASNVTGYSAPVHIIVKPPVSGDGKTAPGCALAEFWEAIGQEFVPASFSGQISALDVLPDFIKDVPAQVSYPRSLSVTTPGRNIGVRIHGYLQPPATGAYTFSISSSDDSALWLTTDAAHPESGEKKQLAAINHIPSATNVWTPANTSSSYSLSAGQSYYFEVVQAFRSSRTPSHVEVAWTGPSIAQEIIPGANLVPYDPTTPAPQSPNPPGTLYPEADTFIRGGGTANSNYGSLPVLNVAANSSAPNGLTKAKGLMTTYSRYDMSSVTGKITKAVLWMYVGATQGGAENTLYAANNDNWSEDGLTFKNSPGYVTKSDSTPFSAGPWTPVQGQWVQQDVTPLVQNAAASADHKFTFAIENTGAASTGSTSYSSKEDAKWLWPHLVLTTSP